MVLAAGIAVALITLVPRLRRLASSRVRPHLVTIWANVKTIATEPRKIFYVVAGLGASPAAGSHRTRRVAARGRAAGQHRDDTRRHYAGLDHRRSHPGAWWPRRRGSGLIAGLTSAGIPQDQAVAAVFIQRLFTAYLPPIWGWATLAWMRRREYV